MFTDCLHLHTDYLRLQDCLCLKPHYLFLQPDCPCLHPDCLRLHPYCFHLQDCLCLHPGCFCLDPGCLSLHPDFLLLQKCLSLQVCCVYVQNVYVYRSGSGALNLVLFRCCLRPQTDVRTVPVVLSVLKILQQGAFSRTRSSVGVSVVLMPLTQNHRHSAAPDALPVSLSEPYSLGSV